MIRYLRCILVAVVTIVAMNMSVYASTVEETIEALDLRSKAASLGHLMLERAYLEQPSRSCISHNLTSLTSDIDARIFNEQLEYQLALERALDTDVSLLIRAGVSRENGQSEPGDVVDTVEWIMHQLYATNRHVEKSLYKLDIDLKEIEIIQITTQKAVLADIVGMLSLASCTESSVPWFSNELFHAMIDLEKWPSWSMHDVPILIAERAELAWPEVKDLIVSTKKRPLEISSHLRNIKNLYYDEARSRIVVAAGTN